MQLWVPVITAFHGFNKKIKAPNIKNIKFETASTQNLNCL
jgi:hypothetical protein